MILIVSILMWIILQSDTNLVGHNFLVKVILEFKFSKFGRYSFLKHLTCNNMVKEKTSNFISSTLFEYVSLSC